MSSYQRRNGTPTDQLRDAMVDSRTLFILRNRNRFTDMLWTISWGFFYPFNFIEFLYLWAQHNGILWACTCHVPSSPCRILIRIGWSALPGSLGTLEEKHKILMAIVSGFGNVREVPRPPIFRHWNSRLDLFRQLVVDSKTYNQVGGLPCATICDEIPGLLQKHVCMVPLNLPLHAWLSLLHM